MRFEVSSEVEMWIVILCNVIGACCHIQMLVALSGR